MNEKETHVTLKIQRIKVVKVDEFKWEFKSVHKRGEEECAGNGGDEHEKDSSTSQREGLEDHKETCYDIWFVDGGTHRKTGG